MREQPVRGRRLRRLGAFGALIAGAMSGAWHALPVEDVKAAGKCPPAQEGLYYCMVQKAWMPVVMEILLLATAAYVIYEIVMNSPGTWRAVRAARRERKAAAAPPFDSDNTLLAASWGNKYEDPKRPKPRRAVDGPIAIPVAPAVTAAAPLPPKRDDPERQRRLERIALAMSLAEQLGLEQQPGDDGIRRRSVA